MKRKVLKNGLVKLWSDNGVLDTRTNLVYAEVICKPEQEKYYIEATPINSEETTEAPKVTKKTRRRK